MGNWNNYAQAEREALIDNIRSTQGSAGIAAAYVDTAGDTMTGSLTITAAAASNFVPLTINQNDTTNNPHAVDINNATAGRVLQLTQSGVNASTDNVLTLTRQSAVTPSIGSAVLSVVNSPTSTATPAVSITDSNTNSNYATIYIVSARAGANGSVLDMQQTATSGSGIRFEAGSLQTGQYIRCDEDTTLTTGHLISLASNSSSASTRTLVTITNTNTSATGATTLSITQAATAPGIVVTTPSANALVIGLAGATNPALQVDSSTASSATGLKLKSAAAAAGYAVSVISSGTDENLTIDAKGAGTISLNATGTGTVSIGSSLTLSAKNIITDTSTGMQIGTATSQKLAFYGSTPIIQRSGAAEAAVITTASTQTTPFGYATQAQADAIITLINEMRTTLVNLGLFKGSA